MITGLLMFLGSAGYLAYKTASSTNAKQDLNIHTKNTGINIPRQCELERMAMGATPFDRQRFIQLLKNADLSKARCREFHESKREYLLSQYERFDEFHRVNPKIQSFSDMIKIDDKNYAVWIISKSEGWTYNKPMISGLPPMCDGYEMFNDPYVKKKARKI